jgi:hypothetical protein
LVVASAVAACGCGSGNSAPASGTGGQGGSAGSIALADFGAAFDAAYCAPLVPCGVYTSLAACEAAIHFGGTTQIVTASTDVQAGTITYDAAAAGACIAALPTDCTAIEPFVDTTMPLSPLNLLAVTPACAGVFTGRLAAGAACQLSWECPPSAGSCSNAGASCAGTACCVGICMDGAIPPPYPLGTNCEIAYCLLPGFCGSSMTCAVLPGEGESCSGDLCGRLDDYCQRPASGGTTGICTKRIPIGQTCPMPSIGQNDPCVLDGGCEPDPANLSTYVCTGQTTLGSPCSGGANDPLCSPWACTADNVCGTPPPGPDCSGVTN